MAGGSPAQWSMMEAMPDPSTGQPTWPEVAALLAPARSYWLGTTNPDGSPHAGICQAQ